MQPCPHCGQMLTIAPSRRLPIQTWNQPANFQSTAQTPFEPPLLPLAGEYERRQPARSASWESDVLVPLAQSAVWGIIGGFLSIGLPVFVQAWPWWTPLPAGVLAGSLAWWIISADHRRALWIVEKMVNRDIDGDGQTGEPQIETPKPSIGLEVVHKTEAGAFVRMFRFDLHESIGEALFQQWGQAVVLGNDLTQARWVNRRKFSRQAYTDLLEKLEAAGLVQRAGSAQNASHELTREGRQTIRRYLALAHTRSLTPSASDLTPDNKAGQGSTHD